MKPKQIKEGEPFILSNGVTYTYVIREGKLILTPVQVAVKKDLSADFEKLWELHQKGNKASAKERLPKVLTKITFEELLSKLQAYIQTNEFTYLKGLDVWLNPIKEHWNDPLVYKEGMKPIDKDNNPMRDMVM